MIEDTMRSIEVSGYAILEQVFSDAILDGLRLQTHSDLPTGTIRQRGSSTFGLRNLLRDNPAIAALAHAPEIQSLIAPLLGSRAFAVRGILFDKTPDANWTVPWHQDLSIPVVRREEAPGFGPWSVKAGVPHVQPPVGVLQNMLTVRVHLDDCGSDKGPLLVIPGSHAHGILSQDQADELRKPHSPVACTVRRCGVVLMRPLLLHASHSAESPSHRRVIHLEYAAADLPMPLQWYAA